MSLNLLSGEAHILLEALHVLRRANGDALASARQAGLLELADTRAVKANEIDRLMARIRRLT